MKKYKLIKKYPGSTEVGEIVQGNGREGWYTKGPGCRTYDWTQVVHYPEYWEEVVEKDYEILISKVVPYTILSVKRLSDGEVFTVGDKIKVTECGSIKNVDGIIIKDGSTFLTEGAWILYNTGMCHLDGVIKIQQLIFLTHDGKDIFEGDTVWYVNKESLNLDHFRTHVNVTFRSDINAYFLTKAAAENYLVQKSHTLSIEDFWEFDSWGGSVIAKSKRLKRLVKERLNLE